MFIHVPFLNANVFVDRLYVSWSVYAQKFTSMVSGVVWDCLAESSMPYAVRQKLTFLSFFCPISILADAVREGLSEKLMSHVPNHS